VLEYFGLDAADGRVSAAMILMVSPLAERVEKLADAPDLLASAVTTAGQDVIAAAMRARTTQALSRGGGVER
jgi:hypothetical protein